MRTLALLTLLTLAACDDGDRDPAHDGATAVIRACGDIDATGLTSATIEQFVARYQGRACTAPLAGGIPSLLQECQYGQSLTVCGGSSGLSQLGCSCGAQGTLSCSDGEAIKEQQERLCDAGVAAVAAPVDAGVD